MGKVVRFSAGAKPVRPSRAKAGGAQILIFTGVRYERAAPDQAGRAPARGPRRKRG